MADGWATDLPVEALCFYAGEDPGHPLATTRVHDSRGCVPCCDHCTRWRASQSRVDGHGETCPEAGVFA